VAGDTDNLTSIALINDYVEAWFTEDGTLDTEAIEKLYASDPDLVFYDAFYLSCSSALRIWFVLEKNYLLT